MTLLGSQVAHADSVEVKPGDTLSSIAQAHNTTVDSLANINGISNINLIIAGETIYTSPDDVKTSGVQYTQPVEVATPSVDNTVQQSVQTQAPVAQEAVVGSDGNSMRELRKSIENGGSYNWDTGNGYFGAYQFAPSTWASTAAAHGLNPNDTSQANRDAMEDAYAQDRYGGWANTPTYGGW